MKYRCRYVTSVNQWIRNDVCGARRCRIVADIKVDYIKASHFKTGATKLNDFISDDNLVTEMKFFPKDY